MYLGWSLCYTNATTTTTTPRLFKEKKKSDCVNAITWVNEWFLKDWIRPNTTLRVKLIITANSRGKRGVQLVCTLTEAHISISSPTHLGIWDRGFLPCFFDKRAVSFFPSCINMYNSDKINWIAYVYIGSRWLGGSEGEIAINILLPNQPVSQADSSVGS